MRSGTAVCEQCQVLHGGSKRSIVRLRDLAPSSAVLLVMATMGPASGRAMEDQLVACVHSSLGLYLYDNACFLCERLVAQFPSEVRRLGRQGAAVSSAAAAAANQVAAAADPRAARHAAAQPVLLQPYSPALCHHLMPPPRSPTCSFWPPATTAATSRTTRTTCCGGCPASRAATSARCVPCSWASSQRRRRR